MGQSRKLIITPWFGQLPEWFSYWRENISRLEKYGYDLLMPTDVNEFKQRVADKLKVTNCPVEYGKAKVHDYRATFGVLYAEELRGYDFYGHTDLDCVYGRIDKFETEALLESCDIHSNHHNYICGPWTMYRNVEIVNTMFRQCPSWRSELESERVSGWVEQEFSKVADSLHAAGKLRLKYTHWQGKNPHDDSNLRWSDESLYDGGDEIMMSHFRHLKRWPHGLQGRS